VTATPGSSVFVEAHARLHFGMLDLRGSLGRRFGGIGAAVPEPSLLLEATPATELSAEGPSATRVLEFAQRFRQHYPSAPAAHIRVRRDIPSHAGLGSGTQLALATARALSELGELTLSVEELGAAVGRARRSAVGTWLFAGGGFVLEGGRFDDRETVAPLLARLPIPDQWRCVLAVPQGSPGVSGEDEVGAFRRLPPPALSDVKRVAHLVLMAMLPALAEGDLTIFGQAITEVQCITGQWFAPAQGGPFAPGASTELVRRFKEWGAPGVGQSSWGPAVYAIVDGEPVANDLAQRARAMLGAAGDVWVTSFARHGARVWRQSSAS